tara:strand:+ start:29111 stop:30070 length:960 start_codon:yes stop_codon:yes gene_type:complete
MNYKRLALFAVLSMILLALSISAAQINSSNYKQTISISSGGITNTSSENYMQSITVGGIAGQTESENYKISLGFQYAVTGLPSEVSLISPANNSVITNRTPMFDWNAAVGGSNITYELLIQRKSCQDLSSCQTDLINITNIKDTNYTLTEMLDVDAVYNWTVRANNTDGYGSYADVFNFTVNSLISVTLPTSSVNFGTLALGSNDNTTDDSPIPITIENDGNININATIYANESLWESKSLNTSFFQFKAGNSTEINAFNWTGSATDWLNVTSYSIGAIKQLNFSDSSDLAEIELYVSVPTDETAGTKTSTLVIESEAS